MKTGRPAIGLALPLAFALVAIAGCGDDSDFGNRCSRDSDCSSGYCCLGRECPGGFCTDSCETDEDCRADTACVRLVAGDHACLLGCTSSEDCSLGTGMECVERDGVLVCLNE